MDDRHPAVVAATDQIVPYLRAEGVTPETAKWVANAFVGAAAGMAVAGPPLLTRDMVVNYLTDSAEEWRQVAELLKAGSDGGVP